MVRCVERCEKLSSLLTSRFLVEVNVVQNYADCCKSKGEIAYCQANETTYHMSYSLLKEVPAML